MIKNELRDLRTSDGKLYGIFRGVVEDNADPLLAGRCKVRVFGIHTATKIKTVTEGIPTAELPWAEPALSLLEGSISGYGLWTVPLNGSHVFVFFENNHILNPRFFASAPGIVSALPTGELGFEDPNAVYPDATGVEYASEAQATYPHNIVLKTHGGHIIEIDSTTGTKRFRMYHPSGYDMAIDDSGNIVISVPGDHTETVTGDQSITVSGNQTVAITGDWTVTIGGDASITVRGDATITFAGICNITGNPLNLN